MTVWLLQQPLAPEEEAHIEANHMLVLPFGNLPDLSSLYSLTHCKQLLQTLHPDAPPETITGMAEQLWQRYNGLQRDDLIAVPLRARRELALADIRKPYVYRDDGAGQHYVMVEWHRQRVKFAALRKHVELLAENAERLEEITNADACAIIRSKLPHGYNRFAKWKWLIALIFAMGMLHRLLQLLGKQ